MVIGLVGGQKRGFGGSVELGLKKAGAKSAGMLLPRLLGVLGRRLSPMNRDGDPPLLGQGAHLSFVRVGGLGPPPVIDMEDVESAWGYDPAPVLGQQYEQRGGIESP